MVVGEGSLKILVVGQYYAVAIDGNTLTRREIAISLQSSCYVKVVTFLSHLHSPSATVMTNPPPSPGSTAASDGFSAEDPCKLAF